jgi:hypothetical protein
MGQPITWHNVGGVSLADAVRPMDAAQRSFNGAFDGLQGVIKDRENVDAANVVNQRNNNTQSYLDKVAELGRTPAQLQASIADGSINKLRESFGPNIDHAATRGAAESLLDQRYKQVQAANEYADKTLTREQRPIHDEILTKAFAGDIKGSMELLAKNPGLMGSPEIQRKVSEYKEILKKQGQDDTRFKWDGERHTWDGQKAKKDLLVADAQIRSSDASADASRANAATQRYNVIASKEDRVQARLDNQYKLASETLGKDTAGGNMYAGGTVDTTDGASAVSKYINETFKDDDHSNQLRSAAAKISGERFDLKGPDGKPVMGPDGKPLKIGIPVGVMIDAVNATKNVKWYNFGQRGDTVSDYVKERMANDPKIMEDAIAKMSIHAVNLKRFAKAAAATPATLTNPPPSLQFGPQSGVVPNPFLEDPKRQ